MIPIPYLLLIKYGLPALIVVSLLIGAYATGRKHVRAAWELERIGNALVAAKADAENRAKEKQSADRVIKAEVLYGQKMLVTTDRANAERRGLRDSAARPRAVPSLPAAGSCPACARCATRAELLGIGEELVRVAEAADRERAGLMSCATAWPLLIFNEESGK